MKAERIFVMLFLIAVTMRLLHWQGGDAMMICALGGLSLTYFLFGFYVFGVPGYRRNTLLLSIISGILLATAPFGMLFKLEYWHMARLQVLFGGMFSLIILVVMIILRSTSVSEYMRGFYRNMIIRAAVLCILCTVLFLTRRHRLLTLEYWDDPKMAVLKTKYYNAPENQQLKQELLEYIRQKNAAAR